MSRASEQQANVEIARIDSQINDRNADLALTLQSMQNATALQVQTLQNRTAMQLGLINAFSTAFTSGLDNYYKASIAKQEMGLRVQQMDNDYRLRTQEIAMQKQESDARTMQMDLANQEKGIALASTKTYSSSLRGMAAAAVIGPDGTDAFNTRYIELEHLEATSGVPMSPADRVELSNLLRDAKKNGVQVMVPTSGATAVSDVFALASLATNQNGAVAATTMTNLDRLAVGLKTGRITDPKAVQEVIDAGVASGGLVKIGTEKFAPVLQGAQAAVAKGDVAGMKAAGDTISAMLLRQGNRGIEMSVESRFAAALGNDASGLKLKEYQAEAAAINETPGIQPDQKEQAKQYLRAVKAGAGATEDWLKRNETSFNSARTAYNDIVRDRLEVPQLITKLDAASAIPGMIPTGFTAYSLMTTDPPKAATEEQSKRINELKRGFATTVAVPVDKALVNDALLAGLPVVTSPQSGESTVLLGDLAKAVRASSSTAQPFALAILQKDAAAQGENILNKFPTAIGEKASEILLYSDKKKPGDELVREKTAALVGKERALADPVAFQAAVLSGTTGPYAEGNATQYATSISRGPVEKLPGGGFVLDDFLLPGVTPSADVVLAIKKELADTKKWYIAAPSLFPSVDETGKVSYPSAEPAWGTTSLFGAADTAARDQPVGYIDALLARNVKTNASRGTSLPETITDLVQTPGQSPETVSALATVLVGSQFDGAKRGKQVTMTADVSRAKTDEAIADQLASTIVAMSKAAEAKEGVALQQLGQIYAEKLTQAAPVSKTYGTGAVTQIQIEEAIARAIGMKPKEREEAVRKILRPLKIEALRQEGAVPSFMSADWTSGLKIKTLQVAPTAGTVSTRSKPEPGTAVQVESLRK